MPVELHEGSVNAHAGRLPDVQSDWKSVNNPKWLASALLMSEN